MQAKELETELDAALIDVEDQISVESCKDHDVSRAWLGRQFFLVRISSARQFQHFPVVFSQYPADQCSMSMTTKQNAVSSCDYCC